MEAYNMWSFVTGRDQLSIWICLTVKHIYMPSTVVIVPLTMGYAYFYHFTIK